MSKRRSYAGPFFVPPTLRPGAKPKEEHASLDTEILRLHTEGLVDTKIAWQLGEHVTRVRKRLRLLAREDGA